MNAPIHGEVQSEYDGGLRRIRDPRLEVKVGMILRDVNPDGTSAPFSDMVVVDITYTRNTWETWTHFHLARPYVFAHLKGPLMNVERFESSTLGYKRIVLDSKGEPFIMKIGE